MKLLLTTISNSSYLGLPLYDKINGGISGNTILGALGLWSFVLACLAIAFVVLICILIDKQYKKFEHFINRKLTYLFLAVWTYAFVVYDVGMYTGEYGSLLGNAPMAFIHAFGIFFFTSDISAIHEPFFENGWYVSAFSFAHFLGALVTLVFVLKHFGFNIVAAFRRRWRVNVKETTYIFWGMNDATYHLAKSINKETTGNCNIVVVRAGNKDDTDENKNGIARLLNFFSLRNKDLDRLKELNCYVINTYKNVTDIDTSPTTGNAANTEDYLNKEMNLKTLIRIINKKTTQTLHLFFLSEDETENIEALAILKRDSTIQAFMTKGHVIFYCHARYNSIHRVIEDEQLNEKMEVRVVDSSHLCVDFLKRKPELHPVRYVKIENDATVSTPFHSLVIGFGEVGLDATRFLYEFGAFVSNGSDKAKVKRSEFRCHVVDKNMEQLAGLFYVNAPSINTTLNAEDNAAKEINLHSLDCQSVEFYKRLENWIKTLNYIVVATGDDELNISMAVRIFRLAIRYRQDQLDRFRILVRVQHDNNGHMQNIAYYYNRLWVADKKKDKDLHQNIITNIESVNEPIYLFGASENIYNYENIINEELKEDARNYKKKYDETRYQRAILSGKEAIKPESWEDEQNNLMQLTAEYKGFSPTYSAVMKLRRVQRQNMANSLHKETKKFLAEKALGRELYEELTKHGLTRKSDSRLYEWTDHSDLPMAHVQRVLDVLAQTEHLRWNASHEILGYKLMVDENKKDEARLLHDCLKSCEELSEEKRIYDYDVVDVSLDIFKNSNCVI